MIKNPEDKLINILYEDGTPSRDWAEEENIAFTNSKGNKMDKNVLIGISDVNKTRMGESNVSRVSAGGLSCRIGPSSCKEKRKEAIDYMHSWSKADSLDFSPEAVEKIKRFLPIVISEAHRAKGT